MEKILLLIICAWLILFVILIFLNFKTVFISLYSTNSCLASAFSLEVINIYFLGNFKFLQ